MTSAKVHFQSGESPEVRHFFIQERMSAYFEISAMVRSRDDNLDLGAIVGRDARFEIETGYAYVRGKGRRFWSGICRNLELVQAETTGLSTYKLIMVPRLWLLTQRRNHRLFQYKNIYDIVEELLSEWSIERTWRIAKEQYPKFELRIQYGESDYHFMCRLLEEVGISFFFGDGENGQSTVIFCAEPHTATPREGSPIRYVDNPNQSAEKEFLTELRLTRDVMPERYTLRDHDFRQSPDYSLVAQNAKDTQDAPGKTLEQYFFAPGSFLVARDTSDSPSFADRPLPSAHDQKAGTIRAEIGFQAWHGQRRRLYFRTNLADMHPGVVFSVDGHPHAELDSANRLLVIELSIEGGIADGKEWVMRGTSVFAAQPFRAPQITPKPKVFGVQSALVVGPSGEEIHTDEFGRVRVQFHWDRRAQYNEQSSPWIRVSQEWAGTGFGMITVPRIGQEVLVGFLEGDPDQPIVVGRLYNGRNVTPYPLPQKKEVSGWRSNSTPGSTGHNEIFLDDSKGNELLFMRAERDLVKEVKHSEMETTEETRTIVVGKRLELTTKQASIILEGPNIVLQAKGVINVRSTDKEVTITGVPTVYINPAPAEMFEDRDATVEGGRDKEIFEFKPYQYARGLAVEGSAAFKKSTADALDAVTKTAAGKAAVEGISESGSTVTIQQTSASNMYVTPHNAKLGQTAGQGISGMGSGSTIHFNPTFSPAGASNAAVLGNGLSHAYQYAQGNAQPGAGGYQQAIGLGAHSSAAVSENAMRAAMGAQARASF